MVLSHPWVGYSTPSLSSEKQRSDLLKRGRATGGSFAGERSSSGWLLSPEVFAEVDTFNFAPRVTIPTLVLNGRRDSVVPVETSQEPMFRLLGTPKEHKRHIIYDEGGHPVKRKE